MDDDVTIMSAKPWGSARVTRWAGTFGFVLPAITLVVYPIWSFPGTHTPGTEVALWGHDSPRSAGRDDAAQYRRRHALAYIRRYVMDLPT